MFNMQDTTAYITHVYNELSLVVLTSACILTPTYWTMKNLFYRVYRKKYTLGKLKILNGKNKYTECVKQTENCSRFDEHFSQLAMVQFG